LQRNKAIYTIAEGQCTILKRRMLNWSRPFSILVFLDSNGYTDQYSRYECLVAAGAHTSIPLADGLSGLSDHHAEHKDWLFGHINYDYKNSMEPALSSKHETVTGFEELSFFCPETVCYINKEQNELVIETFAGDAEAIYEAIMQAPDELQTDVPEVAFNKRTTQDKYLEVVNRLREHIKDGDCYEINYCNENYAERVSLEPLNAFAKLNKISNAPFAAYYRNNESYMMCASPERYVRKDGDTVISQPIKGTARRGSDKEKDELIKRQLSESVKDRAENVMITDLVRNDLARSCTTGSIEVKELFGIYSFPQVHQMISTVSGKLEDGGAVTDAIKYSFPMGSMTGAPKIKVMQLIEDYEDCRRELYSGTIGYITPAGDFDFNVVIRSLFYNAKSGYLCYQAGGAITYDSSAEAEWDEMRLKGWAMERIFSPEGKL